ncbi:hypothetical protein [Streptosporangium sp. NPDC000509]|uniref:hypothetical protein n=1 Tax=Streptosporangium sp. NPDC000509 TaxID=3366186 RepID=UPI0036934BA0
MVTGTIAEAEPFFLVQTHPSGGAVMLVPFAINVTSWGGAVGTGIGLLTLTLVERRRKARREQERASTVGYVLGWRLSDGSLHSATASANVTEAEVTTVARRKSLELDVMEAWVSWRTHDGHRVRRSYADGGRL